MNIKPLSQEELLFLNKIFDKYYDLGTMLNVSELDGFLTAIISAPKIIDPSLWLLFLWYDKEPDWTADDRMELFYALILQQLNNKAVCLRNKTEDFEIIGYSIKSSPKEDFYIDDWCTGYHEATIRIDWPIMPDSLENYLDIITDYSIVEVPDIDDDMFVPKQSQLIPKDLKEAVFNIYAYWMEQRKSS